MTTFYVYFSFSPSATRLVFNLTIYTSNMTGVVYEAGTSYPSQAKVFFVHYVAFVSEMSILDCPIGFFLNAYSRGRSREGM